MKSGQCVCELFSVFHGHCHVHCCRFMSERREWSEKLLGGTLMFGIAQDAFHIRVTVSYAAMKCPISTQYEASDVGDTSLNSVVESLNKVEAEAKVAVEVVPSLQLNIAIVEHIAAYVKGCNAIFTKTGRTKCRPDMKFLSERPEVLHGKQSSRSKRTVVILFHLKQTVSLCANFAQQHGVSDIKMYAYFSSTFQWLVIDIYDTRQNDNKNGVRN